MAKKAKAREVRCYHCGKAFEIAAKAMTVSCPGCFKPVLVEDIVVRNAQGNTTLQTCGRLVVQRRGRVVAKKICASEGVEMLGILEANVQSEGAVRIGATGRWSGNCRAPALKVDAGANIMGGFFEIGPGMGNGTS
jgi:DNA-directed RNA polymerase subunit RPC12/RpoP